MGTGRHQQLVVRGKISEINSVEPQELPYIYVVDSSKAIELEDVGYDTFRLNIRQAA